MEKFSLVQEGQDNNNEVQAASNQEMRERIESVVDTIDTQAIVEVVSDLFEKAHTLDALHREIPIEQVMFPEHDLVDRAQYVNKKHENDSGQIRLNTQRLYNPDSPEKELFDVVHVFVHEQIHAFSDGYTIKNISEQKKKRIIGFAAGIKDKTKNTPSEYLYIELNEGMTELISDYIVKEYFIRTGDVPTSIVEHLQKENAKETYPQGRFLVEGIVSMLSEKYEVPEDIIFKSLIRFYFGPEDEYDSFPEWLEQHEPLTAEGLKRL